MVKTKYTKVIFLEDFGDAKKGELSEMTEKDARAIVKEGICEYVKKEIPKQIKDFNFVLIGGNGKQPIEKSWQKKVHRFRDDVIQKHLKSGKNYGIQPNNSSVLINGESYFLIVIDFDKKEIQEKILNRLPETFTTTSGSEKKCFHLWFASDDNKAFKIKDKNYETLIDVIGSGNQVIGPGSKHPSGSKYSIVKDVPIAFIPYSEIKAILKPFDKSPQKKKKPKKQYIPKGVEKNLSDKILNSVSMEECLQEIGIDISKNPTGCFLHSSQGGKCFSYDYDIAHCFHCGGGWNKYSLIREGKNLTDKETFDWFAEKGGLMQDLEQSRKKYIKSISEKELKEKNFEGITGIEEASKIFTLENQAERFNEIQPLFYDKSGLWWLWNKEKYMWEMVDEVDILNMIHKSTGKDVISSKNRIEILNALKQKGRLNIPKNIEKTWIQFKDTIVDYETGEEFKATHEYFVTNPIPWNLNKERFIETPNMDKIFEEWVGEDYVKTLYEILAYCLIPNYPIHRLFCFIGEGLNGKTCFLRLIQKFVGKDNCTSTELDSLLGSRFEITKLHKKLVCVMGETNFAEMSKTSVIKKLTGQDTIGYEYKNKNPFDDVNYAKIIIATNNLPTTTDKTIGFYRRWLIIDFPNRFSEEKDILSEIPDEEYEILTIKSLKLLKDLMSSKRFHNEGTIEEREKKYEDKSNPFDKFWQEVVIEDTNTNISKKKFKEKLDSWCKEHRFRLLSDLTVFKYMKERGIETIRPIMDWVDVGYGKEKPRYRAWNGIKLKGEDQEL